MRPDENYLARRMDLRLLNWDLINIIVGLTKEKCDSFIRPSYSQSFSELRCVRYDLWWSHNLLTVLTKTVSLTAIVSEIGNKRVAGENKPSTRNKADPVYYICGGFTTPISVRCAPENPPFSVEVIQGFENHKGTEESEKLSQRF